ncbi:replication protein A, subunit RPA32 [Xylona heveae TC161]|uniref:Replication protein A, subunit RPA32 n=1 Tax=Xylona heveae (strain CBS 132557 / TC161) TaxID=1328760 RepID=A0A161TBQ8_XYLHT|nr:replication protein A, subunit RPA32 [Xylona heveae TC161]KZF23127.1 replication protein A, subunit RPA32 [Xylona heveae TC161]
MDYGYGNYQNNAGGGGFMNNGSQGIGENSPGGSASKTYGKDTLRPVTIKQIIDAQQAHPDADFKVDGVEVTQLTFVGQIRNISTQTTNITYKIDDGTGTVEVKQWVDSDVVNSMDTATDAKPKLMENSYARVWGKLKSFSGKRHVGAHIIRPITDHNEVQYHLLEATAVHLFFTRGPPEQLKKGGNAAQGGAAPGQQVGVGGNAADNGGGQSGRALPPLSGPARKIYHTLETSPQSNEGLNVQDISSRVGMQVNDVLKAADELLSQGLIYTTVDDNTWAILDM